MQIIRKGAMLQASIVGLFLSSYHLIIVCALAAFVLSGNQMKAENVFVAAAIFNSVRLQITMALPMGLQHMFQANVTLRRLQASCSFMWTTL